MKLLIYSGFTCIFLLFLFNYKTHQISTTNEIVIYNIKDEIAIDIYYGKQNIFISSNDLMANEDKLLFHIQHYWYYKSGNEGAYKHLDIKNLSSSIFNLNGESFSILAKKINTNKYLTNFVILGKTGFISNEVLNKWLLNSTRLIIHPSCGYKTKRFINSNYPQNLIYDIKNEGAFIFSF